MNHMSSFSSMSSLNSRDTTTSLGKNQLRSNAVSSGYCKSTNILVKNILINPIKNPLENHLISSYIKEYIQIKNIKISEFDSYCWPIILQGN